MTMHPKNTESAPSDLGLHCLFLHIFMVFDEIRLLLNAYIAKLF